MNSLFHKKKDKTFEKSQNQTWNACCWYLHKKT